MSRSLGSGGNQLRTSSSSSVQKGQSGNDTLPPAKAASGLTSPPRRTYTDFLSHTNHDWNANDEEDEEDLGDEYGYENDDGDDFGLPSVSSMKRKSKRLSSPTNADSGRGLSPWGHGAQGSDYHLGPRRLSNSQDIAIERPAPSYPSPKKSEGKILRPQYKEILRGMYYLVRNSMT
jgi:hypothetical protein